jgi:hypothetical protein
VLLACLGLAVLGFLARVVARRRGRTRSWREATTSLPVLGISIVVFTVAADGSMAH